MIGQKLRHTVSIYEAAETSSVDDRGQPDGSPELLASSVPCFVDQRSAGQFQAATEHQDAIGTHIVTMYRSSQIPLTATCHLVWEGRTLNIVGITSDERNREWTIACREMKS